MPLQLLYTKSTFFTLMNSLLKLNRNYIALPILSACLFAVYLLFFTFWRNADSYQSVQLWLTRASVAVLLIYACYNTFYRRLRQFLLEPLSPLNLAIFRLLYFSWHAVALVFFNRSVAAEFIKQYGSYNDSMRMPVEGMAWLSMHLPVNEAIFRVVLPVYSISLLFSFLGLFTRISTKVHFASLLYICFIPLLYGKITHLHHMVWFPGLLAFSNCGHNLSFDRLIGKYILKKEYEDSPKAEFGMPVKLGMLLLGIIYFFPGFWKLWTAGFDWIFTLNVTRQMYVKWGEMNGWLPFFRADAYPLAMVAASIVTIAFELGFIFLCFYRRYRPLLIVTGVLMHTGIYLLMNIPFFTLLPIYVLLIDGGRLFTKNTPVATRYESNAAPRLYGLYAIAGLLIVGNIYAGFTRLSSYPFACYPTFDYMVPEKMDYVRYYGYKNGKPLMEHTELKEQICTYIPDYTLRELEYKLLDAHAHKDTATVSAIANNILTTQKQISKVDSIVIYRAQGGISPEAAEKAMLMEPIYSVRR